MFDAIGGESNAFSSKEYTCVHGRVLDRDLEMATDYLGDMVAGPAIRPDDVASERKVVLEEIALRDDTPDDLIFDVFAEDVFGDHPLGRPVLGTVETVSAASPDSVREFHRAGYAHSLEVWREGELIGGLYGVYVGGVFCGESMFFHNSR